MNQINTKENLNISLEEKVHEPAPATGLSSWFSFSDTSYLKGFALAAGLTFLATSPRVRETIVKGGANIWTYMQAGVEELKEKVQDSRAEMGQAGQPDPEKG